MKSDSRAWELLIDRIPYHWTHFTFTWHKNWGIQHFENGILKSELRSPSAHTEIIFKSSSSLNIGKSNSLAEDEIMAQVLTIMDLFVVKRQLLPSEIKSFIHEGRYSYFLH